MLAVSGHGKSKANDLDFIPPQKIACGGTHTLYLQQVQSHEGITGTKVFGWGGNRNNQLGLRPLRDSDDAPETSAISGPSEQVFCYQDPRGAGDRQTFLDLFEVACGNNHSVVLESVKVAEGGSLKESRLWTFGLNANGQLGHPEGTTSEPLLPAEVRIPDVMNHRVVVQRVCCGNDHTLAIANFVGQSGVVATVMGRVFAWGLASYGALGTKTKNASVPSEVWFPSDVYDEAEPHRMERNVVVQQVAAGTKHSLALCSEGRVYSWGHGGNGRLGLGHSSKAAGSGSSYNAAFEPTVLEALRDAKVRYITVGEAHSGAVDKLGGLHTWGQGSHGRCGHGMALDTNVPTRVETLMGIAIRHIAFGLMHSVATTVKGQLYAWGKGPATGLDASGAIVPTPRQVELPDRDPVYQIAAGALHTLVLVCDGTLYCFGSASEGRLPFKSAITGGAPRDQSFPKKVDSKGWRTDQEKAAESRAADRAKKPADENAADREWWPRHVCSGGPHSAVLLEGGQTNLWFWGSTILTGGTEPAAQQHAGEPEPQGWAPALLKRGFLQPVKMVAIGLEHCLAITVDGQMHSWGNGDKGQLGTGSIRGVMNPQRISHPVNVICISAGEEHSACIIEGGEAYAWGSAEGGRLGLGNCLSEGVQLMPKQVVIMDADGASKQAVLLRSVACGAQHTAFISEDDRLLTCGMGWYGRLGHGNLENQYSPVFVDVGGQLLKSVHCAMHHTCIIDQSDVLWVCGRDNCICRDGLGHQSEPMEFEPFAQEPRRYIRSLAASDQHTLAITFREDGDGAQELWCWGRNNRGQLGLPAAVAPHIDAPWQLRVPELERRGPGRFELRAVSTASAHSLCLAVVKKRIPKSSSYHEEPVLYAWGYSGSGRLGLVKDANERLVQQHQQGIDNSEISGSKQAPVYPPMRVDQRWRPQEAVRRQVGREDDARGEVLTGMHQPSKTWYDLQVKLHDEPHDHKKKRLEESAKEASKIYDDVMHDVLTLWDRPPTGSDIVEYNLRQKQREIESEYIRTLKVLKLGMSMSAPRLVGRIKTDKAFLNLLDRYEELVWVLQQQPLYMSKLAECLAARKSDDPEVVLFHRITDRLYADLKDTRTLLHFKALLRVMMENEMMKANSLDEVFDPTKSRAATLFTQMCTSIHFIDRIAMPIVDPEKADSLVSIIIRYTISKDGVTPRNHKDSTKESKNQPDFSGVFVCKWKEYEELLVQYRTGGGDKGARPEQTKRSRQHFATELRCFKELCVRDEQETEGAPEAHEAGGAGKGKICDFIAHFIRDVLKREDDMRMLFVCAFTHLTQQRYVINQKAIDDGGEGWNSGICSPITTLVLSSILGGVLTAVHSAGIFSLVRLKIRQQVRKLEAEMVDKWNRNHSRRDDLNEVELDTEGLLHRVFFNIQALAAFFRRLVSQRSYMDFGTDGVIEKEEPLARDCAQSLHAATNEVLLSCLRMRGAAGSKSFNVSSRVYEEDTTDTQLIVNLYEAHYSLRRTVVSFSTEELMELANLLWKYSKPNAQDAERGDIRLDVPERDTVHQLLKAVLPRQKARGHSSSGHVDFLTVPWSKEEHMWWAEKHGESHNFTMPARFLEFQRTDEHEPTFCEDSQVPIPRLLAKEAQKEMKATSAVNPLRIPADERGPQVDGVDTFEFIEDLLQELSGTSKEHSSVKYRIQGRTFLELGSELHEVQRQVAQAIEEGRAPATMNTLLQRLEDGKRMVSKIRDVCDEANLLGYIDKGVVRRYEHFRYLRRVMKGTDEVQDARRKYKSDLKTQYALLAHLHSASAFCDIPEDILATAQGQSEHLTFERARVKKLRQRRNHPTPAQRVLDSLKGDTPDSRITDELRDTVGMPARSFKCSELERKGVILSLNDKVSRPVQRQMCFTFQYQDEGYYVQVYNKTTLLKEFMITRQDIHHMQTSRKAADMFYGDELVRVNCFRLLRLLAWVCAEGGL